MSVSQPRTTFAIETVYRICAFLPALGLLTALLPAEPTPSAEAPPPSPAPA